MGARAAWATHRTGGHRAPRSYPAVMACDEPLATRHKAPKIALTAFCQTLVRASWRVTHAAKIETRPLDAQQSI